MDLSIEFFPPKTSHGKNKLREVCSHLAREINPNFFSVTFGAGGSTQEGTLSTVQDIQEAGFKAVPHLSCIGSTRENIFKFLNQYKKMGIRRIVALRGDLPSIKQQSEFHHADELVTFIRQKTSDWFHIEVAAYPEAHPQSKSFPEDLENFTKKIKSGANSAITQYFYNPEAYFRFIEDIRKFGVEAPITPGIMPITNYNQLIRLSETCGTEIPRWIRMRLESYSNDPQSLKSFGLDVVANLCEQLIDGGAPGLHFYSLNQVEPTLELVKRINTN